MIVAVLVRSGVVVATTDYEPVFDAAAFDRYARSLSAGDGYPESTLAASGGPTAYRPPAYPALLGGVYRVSGDSIDAARAVQALLGGATVALTGLLALMLFGRREALAAMAIAAVFPPLIAIETALLSEALLVPLVLAAVVAVLAARRSDRRGRWAVLAGALAGAAILTRANAVVLLVPLAIGLFAPPPGGGRWRAAGPPALMVAAALAVVTPWTVRNAVVLDAFVPLSTQLGYTLAGTYSAEAQSRGRFGTAWIDPHETEYAPLLARRELDEVALDRELRERALDYAAARPGHVALVAATNAARLAHLDPAYTRASVRATGASGAGAVQWSLMALLPLVAAGAVVALRARAGPPFVWLTPALLVLSTLPLASPVRMRAPADPFVVTLAAVGLATIVRRIRHPAAP